MKKIVIFIVGLLLLLPHVTLTAGLGLGSAVGNLENAGASAGVESDTELSSIIGIGIQTALAFVGLIFMVLMIYAGYLWMTARGEEEPIKKAQKIITACVIGLVLVVSAFAITRLVIARFTS